MKSNRINESVKVYAVYRGPQERRAPYERLQPLVFCWRNRQYRVREVTYVWRESRGETELYHFAVTAGEDGARARATETAHRAGGPGSPGVELFSDGLPDDSVYELCYETRSLNWTLASISCEA